MALVSEVMSRRTDTIALRPDSTKQSLIGAMDSFVAAIDQMDHIVMMPSRLMDIPAVSESTKETETIPKSVQNALTPHSANNIDMYSFFHLLKTVRSDLLNGPPSDEEYASDSGNDELSDSDEHCPKMDAQSQKLASAFRHHLSGLQTTLTQLTGAAQYLTHRYQDQMDGGKL